MTLPVENLAETFDALKKPKRIKAMFLAAETEMKPAEIAEELEMSESGVRNYLKDLVNAGVLENGDQYSYTEYGEMISGEVELILFEEEEEWIKVTEKRSRELRERLKHRRKRNLKEKLKSVAGY